MADDTGLKRLRDLLNNAARRLMGDTHREIAETFERLGLPDPAREASKRDRVEASFAAIPDADLPGVAERVLLDRRLVDRTTHDAIQDVLWARQGAHEIPKRTRREIARDLELGDLIHAGNRFMAVLDDWWVLDNDPLDAWLIDNPASLRSRIERHVLRNPGDWSTEDLFDQLGAFAAGDSRFARFLEALVSADSLPDEPSQRQVVETVNSHLRAIGAELCETETDGGYPVFSLVATQTARTRSPKNLVFASLTRKPDIRFRDAVDNDIEIVESAGDVLVYDRPIKGEGLRWRDLQAWWQETQQLPTEDDAKKSLYQRLIHSLPDNSPPQRHLYELYHEIHGAAVPDLPALLPEVWLHWDPKTVRERGPRALLGLRMDFLLLLPHRQRVVIEVDGAHHFSTDDGRPDGARYARNMRADRDLKLRGYEVFRFGATELLDRSSARIILEPFFAELFRRYNVNTRIS